MKQLYRCERCGKLSEDYEEIMTCESRHYIVNRPWCGDGLNEELEERTEYKEGVEEPTVIHIMYSRSYWDGEEWKNESRIGKYKLISSYEMPTTISCE